MSVEGCAVQILTACGIGPQHLFTLLQPFQGQLPQTDQQFNQLCTQLRRYRHISENAPGNVARSAFTEMSVPSQLGTELVELLISLGQLSLEWLQQGEEVLRANSTSSKDLNNATFDRHHKLTFESCALAHNLVARE